jgi:hypothetical protein
VPRVQLLDVIGPADVFAEAAQQLGNPRAYRLQLIGTQAGELKGSNGMRMVVDSTIHDHRGRIDTLLVAGSPLPDELAGKARDQRLAAAAGALGAAAGLGLHRRVFAGGSGPARRQARGDALELDRAAGGVLSPCCRWRPMPST